MFPCPAGCLFDYYSFMSTGMSTGTGRVLALKGVLFFGILMLIGMIALAGVLPVSRAHGAASVAEPRVTSITQITRDGFRKTN
jgi:hypothetical protein